MNPSPQGHTRGTTRPGEYTRPVINDNQDSQSGQDFLLTCLKTHVPCHRPLSVVDSLWRFRCSCDPSTPRQDRTTTPTARNQRAIWPAHWVYGTQRRVSKIIRSLNGARGRFHVQQGSCRKTLAGTAIQSAALCKMQQSTINNQQSTIKHNSFS